MRMRPFLYVKRTVIILSSTLPIQKYLVSLTLCFESTNIFLLASINTFAATEKSMPCFIMLALSLSVFQINLPVCFSISTIKYTLCMAFCQYYYTYKYYPLKYTCVSITNPPLKILNWVHLGYWDTLSDIE